MFSRSRLLAIAAALTLATGTAVAATPAAKPAATPMTAQQQRMSDCSKQSAGKKGTERKAFMSQCMKRVNGVATAPAAAPAAAAATPTPAATPMPAAAAGKPVSAAQMAQRQKMQRCNAEAKTKALKGADRKTFMSGCLKGPGSAAP